MVWPFSTAQPKKYKYSTTSSNLDMPSSRTVSSGSSGHAATSKDGSSGNSVSGPSASNVPSDALKLATDPAVSQSALTPTSPFVMVWYVIDAIMTVVTTCAALLEVARLEDPSLFRWLDTKPLMFVYVTLYYFVAVAVWSPEMTGVTALGSIMAVSIMLGSMEGKMLGMYMASAEKVAQREIRGYSRRIFFWTATNPREAARITRQVLDAIRWFKWGFPIFGVCNKLKGMLGNYIKAKRLQRQKRLRHRTLTQLRLHMSPKERYLEAVKTVQAAYRRHLAHKVLVAKMSGRRERETRAARLIQHKFQKRLQARLHKLRAEHQEELEWDEQKFLLRPDSTFAVYWRYTMLCLVLIDVLSVAMRKEGQRKATLHDVVSGFADVHPECMPQKGKRQWFRGFRRAPPPPLPDFCHTDIHTFRRDAVRAVTDAITLVVTVVATLNVPITFFTGMLNAANDVLEPTPFFKRWIIPGLLLQLLVNPAMRPVLRFLFRAFEWVNDNSPAVLFRTFLFLTPYSTVLLHHFGIAVKWILRRDFFGSQDTRWT